MLTRKGECWRDPFWAARPGQPQDENMEIGMMRYKTASLTRDRPCFSFDVRALSLSASAPETIYFTSIHAVYRSADAGRHWRAIDNAEVAPERWRGAGDSNVHGNGVHCSPRDAGVVIFAAADNGLWRSADGGESFSPVLSGRLHHGDANASGFDPQRPDVFYTILSEAPKADGASGFLHRSGDAGVSFVKMGSPFGDSIPAEFSANALLLRDGAAGGREILLGLASARRMFSAEAAGFGVAASSDEGRTWAFRNDGLDPANRNVTALVADPQRPARLFAGVGSTQSGGRDIAGGLYRSEDGGLRWTRLATGAVRHISAVALSPGKPATLYLAAGGGKYSDEQYERERESRGVFRSTDGGESWTQILAVPCAGFVAVSPRDPRVIYAISVSMNWGKHPANPGVYRSGDGGGTWQRVNHGLPINDRLVSLDFDPRDPAVIWCSTSGAGFIRGREIAP